MTNVIFCVLTLFWWSLKQIGKFKSKHLENSEVMNEWMMHLYSDLLCIVVHQKRFTIMWGGGSLLNHHQCAASTWRMRMLPQDNGTSALATHQLQVERRAGIEPIKWISAPTTHQLSREERQRRSHRANQVYALTPHQLQVERIERDIEPIKCMRSPHTSYRWRGERERNRANQVDALTTHQLQVERRERHRANQVVGCTHHTPSTSEEERES